LRLEPRLQLKVCYDSAPGNRIGGLGIEGTVTANAPRPKISLGEPAPGSPTFPGRATTGGSAASNDVLDVFFDTGIAFHEIGPIDLPDVVASFVMMRAPGPSGGARSGGAPGGTGSAGAAPGAAGAQAPPPAPGTDARVRRASPGEDPDVEVSIIEHLAQLERKWWPLPYQLSAGHAVQVYLARTGSGRRGAQVKILLAIDTLSAAGSKGRFLDPAIDAGRPFRPLDKDELGGFLDHPTTRELLRKLERGGMDAAPFKLAALIEALGPHLPRLRLSQVEDHTPIDVSLILDFGNSRTTGALVESHAGALHSVPLGMRSSADPLSASDGTVDSRITFVPGWFDDLGTPLGVGEGFVIPSVARLGREALDRALETPHRYACSMSSPKRYLWDGAPSEQRWHFAVPIGGEHRPIHGPLLKFVVEEKGGLELRSDGPTAPADPRYAPRTMMLFALAEIVSQALCQVASPAYRRFQGKEGNPRVLRHIVMTYPSGMREEEKASYELLVRNACLLVGHVFHIPGERRANADGREPYLFVDEALAAQMVFLYQEVSETFGGSMEDFVRVYGSEDGTVRIASVDIGGGTCDVMIAEYTDRLAGAGTSLHIKELFQDGVSVAGDEVCRALVETVVFPQILQQLDHAARLKLVHLFGEGDGGHGAAWRSLKAKLVPYFWLPLARAFWAVAEGFAIPGHVPDRAYSVDDLSRIFEGGAWSPAVLAEADAFLGGTGAAGRESLVPGFPGLRNLFFRFERAEVEGCIAAVLREPLRRYADIVAQFDADVLVLAGRTSSLPCVRDIFLEEMPVAPPRIKSMTRYRVGDWYPSKWREAGKIVDAKSTVVAGATILHLARRNLLSGFLLESVEPAPQRPIYGIYQDMPPQIPHGSELFPDGPRSRPFSYTAGMRIGFRNVDSQEMDGSPLFEVTPASPEVEAALREDRVQIAFEQKRDGSIAIAEVTSQRGVHTFSPSDFVLGLKTAQTDRYWLDTGVFRNVEREMTSSASLGRAAEAK